MWERFHRIRYRTLFLFGVLGLVLLVHLIMLLRVATGRPPFPRLSFLSKRYTTQELQKAVLGITASELRSKFGAPDEITALPGPSRTFARTEDYADGIQVAAGRSGSADNGIWHYRDLLCYPDGSAMPGTVMIEVRQGRVSSISP